MMSLPRAMSEAPRLQLVAVRNATVLGVWSPQTTNMKTSTLPIDALVS